jgi:hypothetical protein
MCSTGSTNQGEKSFKEDKRVSTGSKGPSKGISPTGKTSQARTLNRKLSHRLAETISNKNAGVITQHAEGLRPKRKNLFTPNAEKF